jgi:NDP-sugar pyrophosphorylase family protein
MKAIILAAGRGVRMGDLTKDRPKPMLVHKGKTLLEHKLDLLPEEIDEVIIVVGYLKDVIKNHFGNEYKGKRIEYVHMDELSGTGPALWLCKDLVDERFIVMMGDDIYPEEAIKEALAKDLWTITVEQFNEPRRGTVETDEFGLLADYEEEVTDKVPAFVNTGFYTLTPDIFDYEPVQIPGRNEWGLPHVILSATKDFPVKVLYTKGWKQITGPEDLD